MSYVKAFLIKEYCEQCGFELLDNEFNYCSEHCQKMGKHDTDDWQFETPYKVEPKSSDE
tara:strand:+ start:57 stop:233 length:177 start_codon:yes stop_codon:yes gene_type:complete